MHIIKKIGLNLFIPLTYTFRLCTTVFTENNKHSCRLLQRRAVAHISEPATRSTVHASTQDSYFWYCKHSAVNGGTSDEALIVARSVSHVGE